MKAVQVFLLVIIIGLLAYVQVERFEDPTSLDIRVYPVQGPGSYCLFAIDKYGQWDASCFLGAMPAQPTPAPGPSS